MTDPHHVVFLLLPGEALVAKFTVLTGFDSEMGHRLASLGASVYGSYTFGAAFYYVGMNIDFKFTDRHFRFWICSGHIGEVDVYAKFFLGFNCFWRILTAVNIQFVTTSVIFEFGEPFLDESYIAGVIGRYLVVGYQLERIIL